MLHLLRRQELLDKHHKGELRAVTQALGSARLCSATEVWCNLRLIPGVFDLFFIRFLTPHMWECVKDVLMEYNHSNHSSPIRMAWWFRSSHLNGTGDMGEVKDSERPHGFLRSQQECDGTARHRKTKLSNKSWHAIAAPTCTYPE